MSRPTPFPLSGRPVGASVPLRSAEQTESRPAARAARGRRCCRPRAPRGSIQAPDGCAQHALTVFAPSGVARGGHAYRIGRSAIGARASHGMRASPTEARAEGARPRSDRRIADSPSLSLSRRAAARATSHLRIASATQFRPPAAAVAAGPSRSRPQPIRAAGQCGLANPTWPRCPAADDGPDGPEHVVLGGAARRVGPAAVRRSAACLDQPRVEARRTIRQLAS